MAGTVRVTSAGALAEVAPDQQAWITSAGVYAEFRAIVYAYITAAGAYLEAGPLGTVPAVGRVFTHGIVTAGSRPAAAGHVYLCDTLVKATPAVSGTVYLSNVKG